MRDIPQPLMELLDKQALHDLAMRYARAIDRRDNELLLSLYHEDAIDEHGTVFAGSPTDYAAAQPTLMKDFVITAHYITNTLYEIDGDNANGELYFLAYHRTGSESPQEITVGGRYLDRYQKRNGEWRIQHRILVWDHLSTTPVAAADMDRLQSLGVQGKGREDISRDFLPLLD